MPPKVDGVIAHCRAGSSRTAVKARAMSGVKIRLLAIGVVSILSGGAGAADAGIAAATRPAAAAAALALPFERFTLPNGLTVIVHTDHKAPVVAIAIRYGVGAKNEPATRSGFAHLFEHLMFAGSTVAPGDFFQRMRDLGATAVNGNTSYDDTFFWETVPTGSLARALFLEAGRMGHMTQAITQEVLDVNRGIVRNEKRGAENQPYGLSYQRSIGRLFPKGHPFDHPVLGSMAALDAASVADVRAWHDAYYRPNNAVLVLSGDVDLATARVLVGRYFGDLRAGPPVPRPLVPIPVLRAPIADVDHDRVAQTTVTRHWLTPGLKGADAPALDVAAKVLGTLTGAWLDQGLIRDGLASSLTTSAGASADIGTFVISYAVADGVDPQRVAARLDALLARFARTGPTEDEIRRVVMRDIGWQTQRLETAAVQAELLSDGQLLFGNPLFYRTTLLAEAEVTPRQVREAVSRWLLERPAYTLTIAPGARAAYEEATATGPAAPAARNPAVVPAEPARPLPPIGDPAAVRFPPIERVRLSNGIELVYARRGGLPLTRVAMTFDGGSAADPADAPGAQSLLLAMLREGTTGADAAALSRAGQRLGADMTFSAGSDQSVGTITMPSEAFVPALDLFADVISHPALTPAALERTKAMSLAALRQSSTSPDPSARRAMAPLLFGREGTYGRDAGTADAAGLTALTRERLLTLYRQWIRADKARIFMVSDLPLATVRAAAERAFGHWQVEGAPGEAAYVAALQAPARIVLIDRPDSPQSLIVGATRTSFDGAHATDERFAASVANEALGGFRGRINADLRERRGWTYGASGGFAQFAHADVYRVTTSVEADRTGEALAVVRREMADYVGNVPMTAEEYARTVDAALPSLPGRFESGASVLAMMQADQLFGRPDDYPATLPVRYRALDRDIAMAAIRAALDPSRMLWVVVGDARRIRPQLEKLGLPVETASGS
jgi:predicted Zn-dependent peptidase